MRTYIIGNDGIALCRKAPATVSDGEIVFAGGNRIRTVSPAGGVAFSSPVRANFSCVRQVQQIGHGTGTG